MSERNRLSKAVGQVASGYLLIHLNRLSTHGE